MPARRLAALGFAVLVVAGGRAWADAPSSAFATPEFTATVSGAPLDHSPGIATPAVRTPCQETRDTIASVSALVMGIAGLAGTIAFWRTPYGVEHEVAGWVTVVTYPLGAILGAEIGYRLGLFVAPSCRNRPGGP